MTTSAGKTFALTYTLTLDNGTLIDSNMDAEPLIFTQGEHELIFGLETSLEGRQAGERFRVSVPPEDGYGVISADAFIKVPTEHLPPDARQVGAQITAVGPEGQELQGLVVELAETAATVDFNHPLAGKVLHFEIIILSIS